MWDLKSLPTAWPRTPVVPGLGRLRGLAGLGLGLSCSEWLSLWVGAGTLAGASSEPQQACERGRHCHLPGGGGCCSEGSSPPPSHPRAPVRRPPPPPRGFLLPALQRHCRGRRGGPAAQAVSSSLKWGCDTRTDPHWLLTQKMGPQRSSPRARGRPSWSGGRSFCEPTVQEMLGPLRGPLSDKHSPMSGHVRSAQPRGGGARLARVQRPCPPTQPPWCPLTRPPRSGGPGPGLPGVPRPGRCPPTRPSRRGLPGLPDGVFPQGLPGDRRERPVVTCCQKHVLCKLLSVFFKIYF